MTASDKLAAFLSHIVAVVEEAEGFYDAERKHVQRGTAKCCNYCGNTWPCESAALSDALDALNARLG
jgi:hypothetical protein